MLFGKKKKRETPTLDTTSTADISFMLLIFFLVTTSLDTEEGISRRLAPMPQKSEQKQMDVNRRDLMSISIDGDDRLTCDGDTITPQQLTKRAEKFITERGSRHVISIKTDRQTSYDTYFAMQNAIMNAYANVRDAMARKAYRTTFAKCDAGQRDEIIRRCPQRISEAEPTEKGGAE